MVDTGAKTLVINEVTRRQLGLDLKEECRVTLANKTTVTCNYTSPVNVHWKNRFCSVRALVLPKTAEILSGAILLEDVDLAIDLAGQEMPGVNDNEALSIICWRQTPAVHPRIVPRFGRRAKRKNLTQQFSL